MHPLRAVATKSHSAPDIPPLPSRHNSICIINSRSTTPIDMPLLLTEPELAADHPLQFYPDDGLIRNETNERIVFSIKFVLTAPALYTDSKRKIIENAINGGYKKTLDSLFNEIRRAGGVLNLEFVDLSNLSLTDLDLHGANIKNATLVNSDLSRSNLTNTRLVCTDLTGVTARDTVFDRAIFDWTAVGGMTTNNHWIAKEGERVTEAYPDKKITNVFVTGVCPAQAGVARVVTLPPRTIVRSCCHCVIL